jgi:glycosyltransferase involved in cell wall biosynthesis
VFVVPIHHPVDAITQFEKRLKGLAFRTLATVFPDFYAREKAKNLARFLKVPSYLITSIKHLFINYRAEIAKLLGNADGIVYISKGERLSVQADFGIVNDRYVIAHNAVTNAPNAAADEEKIYDVIVVGRIEQRKNQLNIAKEFSKSVYKVLFVGPANANSNEFFEEFTRVVDASGGRLSYIGPKSHAETLRLIGRSRLLLNASYFEVNPLVDLEACLTGTQVVTTKYSYTKEVMPNVIELDPWDTNSYVATVEAVLAGHHDTIGGAKVEISWQSAGIMIDSLLQQVRH